MKKPGYIIAVAGLAGLLLTTPYVLSKNPKTGYYTVKKTEAKEQEIVNIETLSQLEKIIADNKYVVIDIGATWCGPCKEYKPIFEEVAEEYKDKIVFCEVVLDKIESKEDRAISKKYSVKYIPKTILFKDGKEVHNRFGYMEKTELTDLIETYLLEKNSGK